MNKYQHLILFRTRRGTAFLFCLAAGLLVTAWPVRATLFRLPIAVNTSVHYYYDHGNVTDWKCGGETYSGHRGTDFSGGPRGKPIYAGAVGTLNYRIDGYGDGYYGDYADGGGFGNHVVLTHAGGFTTYYGHMTYGSVTTKSVGSSIACGEQIGGVGTSGNSTGLHLHFEPRINGVADDPYQGSCGGPLTYWVNQNGGNPTTTCEGGGTGGADGASFVSENYPDGSVLSPGQAFTKQFTMKNSGGTTWVANGVNGYTFNHIADVPASPNLGAPFQTIPSGNVGPGANYTFNIPLTAPTTPGNYEADFRMNNSAGAYFGDTVWVKIVVSQPPPMNNASVVSLSAPGTVAVGEVFQASVVMNNSGTKTWASGGPNPHNLGSQSPQDNTTWGFGRVGLPFSPVNPGQNATFTFNATAPSSPGTYAFAWKMVQEGVEWFGATASMNISVVIPPPTITAQPQTRTNNPGETAALSVSASGASPLSYQWQKNGNNLSGATLTTLNITNVQMSDAGFYTVVVSNPGGSVTSQQAQLVITSTVASNGNGGGLQGAYYDNIDFSNLKVTRTDPTVDFNWGTGSPDPSIANTAYSVRWTGQVQPRFSQNYTFYTTTDDGVRLWVNGVLLIDKWLDQAPTEWSGAIDLTAGQKYDLRMDYYQGSGGAAASLSWSSASQVKEIIPSSQSYIYLLPAIVTQPQPAAQTVAPGANVTFNVSATGTAPLNYQWQLNGISIPGATSPSYTRNNVQSADVGIYNVLVTNSAGSVLSADAAVSINDAVVFTDDFESGSLNNWAVAVSPATALAISTAQHNSGSYSAWLNDSYNKMYHNLPAKVEGHARFTYYLYDAVGGTGANGQTRCYGEVRAHSGAGYPNGLLQLFAAGRYSISFGSGNTGNLAGEVVNDANYQGRVTAGPNTGWFNLNAAGVPNRSIGWHKFEIERMANGSTINFYVDGVLGRQITSATYAPMDSALIGSIGSGTHVGADAWFDDVKVEYFDPPSINPQPANQSVTVGGGATFNIGASGNVQSYQWRVNGVNVPGATSASLTLNNVQPSDAGSYTCVVENKIGPTTSAPATLTVNVPPAISSQPQSWVVLAGSNITFTVTAAGTTPLSYQWQFNGVNQAAATNSSLALIAVTTNQSGPYQVIVTNVAGSATSAVATLSVYNTAAASFRSPAWLSGQFQFNLDGVPGYNYAVQVSLDLRNWVTIATNTAPAVFTDPKAGEFPARFYRALYVP